MDLFNNDIKNIKYNNLLKKVMDKMNKYYKIFENLTNNYDKQNSNLKYFIIKANYNNIIIQDYNSISSSNSIVIKFINIFNI